MKDEGGTGLATSWTSTKLLALGFQSSALDAHGCFSRGVSILTLMESSSSPRLIWRLRFAGCSFGYPALERSGHLNIPPIHFQHHVAHFQAGPGGGAILLDLYQAATGVIVY